MRCFLHDIIVVTGMLHPLVYLPKEDATVFAEVQGVAVLLLHWVMLLQGEVHQLPVHVVTLG